MKKKSYSKSKIILSLLLVISLLVTTSASVFAIEISEGNDYIKSTPLAGNYIESEVAAKLLSRIELFEGSGSDFRLDKVPTKLEGLIIYIKLLGKDNEALMTSSEPCKFSDISYREKAYINYAFENKLLNGIGEGSFNPSQPLDENTFFTLLLRALGYDDRAGDFSVSDARSKAFEAGFLSDSMYNNFAADGFQRDSMAQVCYFALLTKMKGTEKTLAEELVSKGAIERSIATEICILPAENIFCEDFESNTTDGWNIYGGPWLAEILGLKAASEVPSKAIAEGTNFSDFIYKAYITVVYDYSNNSDSSIIFRVKNPKNGINMYDGYFAGIDNHKKEVMLGKSSSITGEMTIIKSVPIKKYANCGYYLKVMANGNNIKVYLDDELYIDVKDDSYLSGAIGLRAYKPGAYFDKIIAYELTEENKDSEQEISAQYNNYIKYFYDNDKKWYTSQGKNNKTFVPTDSLPVNDETLINFTKELTKGIDNDYEKAKVIYHWVINNIYYDCTRPCYETYLDAREIFKYKYTACAGYSRLLATLMNISGIPCVVVGGYTTYDYDKNYNQNHAWNEAYIDGRWVIMDSTWDNFNKYKDGKFIACPRFNLKYFDPTLEEFSHDHKIETYYR